MNPSSPLNGLNPYARNGGTLPTGLGKTGGGYGNNIPNLMSQEPIRQKTQTKAILKADE